MSFLVIDETNRLGPKVQFRLEASDSANKGILTVDGIDRLLSGTSIVVHITAQDWCEKEVPMSSESLDKYLKSRIHPLTIDGIYEHMSDTTD